MLNILWLDLLATLTLASYLRSRRYAENPRIWKMLSCHSFIPCLSNLSDLIVVLCLKQLKYFNILFYVYFMYLDFLFFLCIKVQRRLILWMRHWIRYIYGKRKFKLFYASNNLFCSLILLTVNILQRKRLKQEVWKCRLSIFIYIPAN